MVIGSDVPSYIYTSINDRPIQQRFETRARNSHVLNRRLKFRTTCQSWRNSTPALEICPYIGVIKKGSSLDHSTTSWLSRYSIFIPYHEPLISCTIVEKENRDCTYRSHVTWYTRVISDVFTDIIYIRIIEREIGNTPFI